MRLADLPVPITAAAAAAREVAAAYCSPALFNHSVRAHLFGAAYALSSGISVDDELLYVSAMLHDIGLVEAFDSHRMDFEYAGGHVAWVFCAGAGWPVERRQRALDVIVAHMIDISPEDDPEGHVLSMSTGMDIAGRDLDRLSPGLIDEVLAAYPRAGLTAEFTACFTDQAARKPDSTAGAAVRRGFAERVAKNPLDA